MPNWAESEMSVVLPTENADKFETLFLGNRADNEKKERYFARCFLQNCERESNAHGLTRLYIQFDVAWSLHSCMINGYPQESEGTCPTLEEICRELQVVRLTAYSREPGMGFEECLDYTRDGGLTSDSRDLYPEPIADYLEENEKLPDFNEVMS